jgi:hypothetical protein
VPRSEYENALRLARQHSQEQGRKIEELQRRLTAVNNTLPAPEEGHYKADENEAPF